MKIRTFWQAAEMPEDEKVYEINHEPSLTVNDGYEDLSDMIPRIIRGDLPSYRQQLHYELGSDVKDDDFDRPDFDSLDDLTDIDDAVDIVKAAGSRRAQPQAVGTEEPAAPARGAGKSPAAEAAEPPEAAKE